MLDILLKWGRKVLILLLMAFLLTTNIGYTQSNDYIKFTNFFVKIIIAII